MAKPNSKEEAKLARGHFIHGANWCAKWVRENTQSGSFIRTPGNDLIREAAQERYPWEETRRRVLPHLQYNGYVYLRMGVGANGMPCVEFWGNPDCTQGLTAKPEMDLHLVEDMAELLRNPYETVQV